MTDAQACVWTLCLAALVLCALTGPLVAVLTPLPPRPPSTSWPPSSPPPSSARMWPSPPCSSSPSCASCGPVWTARASPCGSAAAALGRGATSPSRDLRAWCYFSTTGAPTGLGSWYHRAAKRGTIRSSSSKGMELRWSHVLSVKTGGWRGHGATLYLGRGTTRSSSTIAALVPSPREAARAHGWQGRPRAQRRGGGYGAGSTPA